ncbi:helix-turn-helix domain-containing protein [Mucilaginibacter ginsenosidivorax]|uniref:Helix-turn-helix transcriptional regulator n=1 Tax=Mucilaginibacter ginsenosidivorax TaxID=862126 RepID=A0A5B8W3Q3_9SPHI|nr:helix-turn-helix transcriptional regulator [Mucilaginibacter ginsenosidivorax]QEC78353.1 helix-turn-helix transcriptional regulator [Mucilaginibacter ginsenosidivorax]
MQEVKKTDLDLYIINKVKELRLKNNVSQAVLAIKLDVSDAFIGQIENPKHRAKYNITHINKLAQIFSCSPKDFLPDNPII